MMTILSSFTIYTGNHIRTFFMYFLLIKFVFDYLQVIIRGITNMIKRKFLTALITFVISTFIIAILFPPEAFFSDQQTGSSFHDLLMISHL